MVKKKFIDPKKAVKFQVVHRSQRDPRMADETASKLVLRQIPLSANLKGKGVLDAGAFFEDGRLPADLAESIDADVSDDAGDLDGSDEFDDDQVDDDDSDDDDAEDDADDDDTEDPKDGGARQKSRERSRLKAYDGYTKAKNDPSLYGIFFDDQENYDYMQHLKPMGEDPTARFIEAKSIKKPERSSGIKFRDDSAADSKGPVVPGPIGLPTGVLPSEQEEDVGLLARLAAPSGGLDLDLGDDVREVLHALDDDEYVEDDLDDDFFGALNAEQVPEKFQALVEEADQHQDESYDDFDEDADAQGAPEWMKEFKRFQRHGKAARQQDALSDASDDTDATPKDPRSQSARKPAASRGARTATTSFSMSSSSMFRNEKLTLLDDQFEKVLAEYSDEEIGELDPEDPEVVGVVDAMAALRAASGRGIDLDDGSAGASQLNAMFDDFLASTQVVAHGRAVIPARQNLEVLRDGLRDAIDVQAVKQKYGEEVVYEDGEQQARRDADIIMPEEKRRETWDIESMVSTYSNIYNRPKLIQEVSRGAPQIRLKGKHGMPSIVVPSRRAQDAGDDDDGDDSGDDAAGADGSGDEDVEPGNKGAARNKAETKEEKKQRKALVKAERRESRESKKSTKSAFQQEKSRQARLAPNDRQGRSIPLGV